MTIMLATKVATLGTFLILMNCRPSDGAKLNFSEPTSVSWVKMQIGGELNDSTFIVVYQKTLDQVNTICNVLTKSDFNAGGNLTLICLNSTKVTEIWSSEAQSAPGVSVNLTSSGYGCHVYLPFGNVTFSSDVVKLNEQVTLTCPTPGTYLVVPGKDPVEKVVLNCTYDERKQYPEFSTCIFDYMWSECYKVCNVSVLRDRNFKAIPILMSDTNHSLECREGYRMRGTREIKCNAQWEATFDRNVTCVNESHWCVDPMSRSPNRTIDPESFVNSTCSTKMDVRAQCVKGELFVGNETLDQYCSLCFINMSLLHPNATTSVTSLKAGDYHLIECKSGTQLHGLAHLECTQSSQLIYPNCYTCSKDEYFCFPILPPFIPTGPNQSLLATGDKVNISCSPAPGPTLFGNKANLTEVVCLNGTYFEVTSNRKPSCNRICKSPPTIINGDFATSTKHFLNQETVQYSCHDFFMTKNSTKTGNVTCLDGSWRDVENCTKLDFCAEIKNDTIAAITTYPNETMKWKCKDEASTFVIKDTTLKEIVLVCDRKSKKWNETIESLHCVPMTTTMPPTTTVTMVTSTDPETTSEKFTNSTITAPETTTISVGTNGTLTTPSVQTTPGVTAPGLTTPGPTNTSTLTTTRNNSTTVTPPVPSTTEASTTKKLVDLYFPKMPEYEVTYEKTAAVYLPNIGGETAGALTIVGPFGFGDATTLPGNCCVQVNFTGGPFPPNRTVCLFRPHLCPEGLSLSMWIKYSYPKSYSGFSNLNHANFPRHYIFSSGGNEDGTSGVALYLQGLYLVAEVVTDKHVWRVDVIATLKPTDWNNVAIRWKPANYSSTNVSLMGGLELFVSLRKYGHSVEPESIPTSLGSIDPPVARFGCHQSAGNRNLRGFFEEPISIDEFVFWDKYIRDNETLKFLGGYDPSMSKLTADSVNKILENVDLSDPKSQGVVVNFLNKLVDTPVEIQTTTGYPVVSTYDHRLTSNRTDNLTTPMMTTTRGPTTINSQELNDAKKANLQVITSILGKMTDLKSVRANQTESEFENFMKLLSVIDKTMIEGNEDIWRQIQKQINNPGAAGVVTSLAEWIFQNLRQIMISARQKDYGYAFHGMNFDILANKTLGRDFKQFPYQKFPGGPSKDIRLAENSALIPTDIFERCDNTYINTVFMQLNEYNRIAPVRVNPLDINPKMNSTLDAEVIILLANASYQSEKDARCTINKEKLKRSKIMIELAHLTQTEAKFSNRRLLFFDEKLDYTVMQRSCVLWNPSISDYGSWDPTDCGIFQTNATHTLCRCEKFGIVSLLAVSLPQQVTPKDAMWIMILKYILYGLSSICLLVFILTVWKTKSLREQFHVLRSHLAFAVLIASIATVLSDIDCMRHNRIPNIILSSLIQMFYLASGSLLWMDGWASFQAIIYGVIGGMLKSYIPLAWGIPTLFLGLTYILGSSRYGTDLSCFISVDNDLKLYYFGPLLAVGLMAVVLASIVYCNIGTAAVRNEVILLEISSISKGSTYVILYFNCVWIVGFLTFYTFDGPMPNFRSLFHILNSAMGIVIFVFMGLYSPRYMDAIKGRVEERRKFLLHHAVNTQQRIKEEKVRNKPHDSQLNLKEETEEDDSEEEPHVIRRKRIIAS